MKSILLKRVSVLLIVVASLISWFPVSSVHASIAPCNVVVSPTTLLPSSQVRLNFEITNSDENEDIRTIKILRPSASYEIVNGHTDFWSIASNSDEITFVDGSIEPGGSQSVEVEVIADSNQSSMSSWGVYVTDQSDGSDAVGCTGSSSTQITNQAPFAIGGINVSNITTNSVNVNWLTNRPASSKIQWGKSTGYGQTIELGDGVLRTQHSITLNNLSAETIYHFIISGIANDGQSSISPDNSFLTASTPKVGPVVPPSQSGTGSIDITNTNPSLVNNPFIKATPTENIPPTISSSTVLQKIYKETPNIQGKSTDNAEVALIEYSVDGGKNWLPADNMIGLGTSSVVFGFTPKNLLDGDYEIVIRATDSSKNISVLKLGKIVIDKLPPIVGGNTMSVGSQFIQSDSDGTMHALAGVDQKISLSAVGGATSINVEAYVEGQEKPVQVFGLSSSSNNGLWSGALSFSKGGEYLLNIKSVDGADNITNRTLGKIKVRNMGKITEGNLKSSAEAEILAYYKDPQTGAWILWDAGSYGQSNPVKTTSSRGYGFYLPSGTYYLKVKKKGYRTVTSKSFTLNNLSAVASDFSLTKSLGVSIGPVRLQVPKFTATPVVLSTASSNKTGKEVRSKELPVFDLELTDGNRVRTVDVYGNPTILSLVSSWSTDSQDQLKILADLAKEYPELKLIPVSSGESISRLSALNNIAGYKIPIASDPSNSLIDSLDSSSLPTHYFIDRRGMVIKQVVGVLSKEELIKNVTN